MPVIKVWAYFVKLSLFLYAFFDYSSFFFVYQMCRWIIAVMSQWATCFDIRLQWTAFLWLHWSFSAASGIYDITQIPCIEISDTCVSYWDQLVVTSPILVDKHATWGKHEHRFHIELECVNIENYIRSSSKDFRWHSVQMKVSVCSGEKDRGVLVHGQLHKSQH